MSFQSLIGIIEDFDLLRSFSSVLLFQVSIPDRDYRGFRRFTAGTLVANALFQSLIGIIEDFDADSKLTEF